MRRLRSRAPVDDVYPSRGYTCNYRMEELVSAYLASHYFIFYFFIRVCVAFKVHCIRHKPSHSTPNAHVTLSLERRSCRRCRRCRHRGRRCSRLPAPLPLPLPATANSVRATNFLPTNCIIIKIGLNSCVVAERSSCPSKVANEFFGYAKPFEYLARISVGERTNEREKWNEQKRFFTFCIRFSVA